MKKRSFRTARAARMTGKSPRKRVDALHWRGRLRVAQVVHQSDYAAAPRLLRDVLRNTLPDAQERRYRRILGFKDEAQDGPRTLPLAEAARPVIDLEAFARWAEDLLWPARPMTARPVTARSGASNCRE